MLEREPPAHTRLRRLVNRAFVSRAVERLRPRVEALADDLLDALPDGAAGRRGRGVDLMPAYAEPIPVAVIAELLGVPAADAPLLLGWSHRMVAMYRAGRTRADEDGGRRGDARLLGLPARPPRGSAARGPGTTS